MIRKLLAATAVAATMTGAAHAVVLVDQGATLGGPGNEIIAATVLAQESSLATTASRTGIFGLRVSTTGTIPPGQNVFMRLNVTGGVWANALTGAEVVRGATGATVNDQSTNSVRYLMTTDAGPTAITGAALPTGQSDHIEFRFPVLVNGCNVVNFTVNEFQTEVAQTPIENGNTPATIAANALGLLPITCLSAFNASLAPDALPVGYTSLSFTADLVTPGPAFSNFVITASDVAENTAILGTYTLSIFGTAVTSLTTLAPVVIGNVLGFTTTANFASAASPAIASCQAAATNGTFFTAPAANTTTTSCTIIGNTPGVAPMMGNNTGSFLVNLDTTLPITGAVAQAVTVSGANLNLDTSAGLNATDPIGLAIVSTQATGTPDVEDLVYAGAHFGPFDWVGDQSLPTNNVFRVTGLSGTGTLQARVILQNSSAGVNGNFGFTIGGAGTTFTPTNGELIINAPRLNQIVGQNFGRADVTLVFSRTDSQNNTTGDLDVDRLMSSAAGSAVVSSFGDGANAAGAGAAGQTSAGVYVRDDQTNN